MSIDFNQTGAGKNFNKAIRHIAESCQKLLIFARGFLDFYTIFNRRIVKLGFSFLLNLKMTIVLLNLKMTILLNGRFTEFTTLFGLSFTL